MVRATRDRTAEIFQLYRGMNASMDDICGDYDESQLEVLAVRCPIEKKEMLVEAAPERFFDDDHYRGFPAVLVRLPRIDEYELGALLREAWRLQAPKTLKAARPDV